MTTKAADVLELGRARALLGCSSSMSLVEGVQRIKQQRDDLLAACEMLTEAQRRADAGERDGFGCYVDAVDMARAAIARTKEQP